MVVNRNYYGKMNPRRVEAVLEKVKKPEEQAG
jgi:hypothetical protein